MFKDLPLHDVTLQTIFVDWRAGVCTLGLEAGSGHQELIFSGLISITIPRGQPWGPTTSINEVRERDGIYEIEVQSGDVVSVVAESWRFLDTAARSNPTFQRTASPPLN